MNSEKPEPLKDMKHVSGEEIPNQDSQAAVLQKISDQQYSVSQNSRGAEIDALHLDSAPLPPGNDAGSEPRSSPTPDRNIPAPSALRSAPDLSGTPGRPSGGSGGPSTFVGGGNRKTYSEPPSASAGEFSSASGHGFVEKPQTTLSAESYPPGPAPNPASNFASNFASNAALQHSDASAPSASPRAFLSAPQLERSISGGNVSSAAAAASRPAGDSSPLSPTAKIPRPYQGLTGSDSVHQSQAVGDSQPAPRPSWNEARSQALGQTAGDGPLQALAAAQRSPASNTVLNTAVSDRAPIVPSPTTSHLEGQLPSAASSPDRHLGGGPAAATGHLTPEYQRAGRSQIDATKEGQIAYGLTPDGREHPFGLAGRLFEGHTGPTKAEASCTVAGDGTGRTPGSSNPVADGGAPGIIGQIFDGYAGWKLPEIRSPRDDKKGNGDSSPEGRRSNQPTGKSAGDALIGIIDNVKGGIKGGVKSGARAAEKLNPLTDGSTNKGDIKVDRTEGSEHYSAANKFGKAPDYLVLTGVKTKPRPVGADGAQTSVVAIVAPFLSGANAGLRVAKDLITKSDVIVAKIGSMTSDRVKPPVIAVEGVPEFFEQGRLKARPSVNLHLPGGKYDDSKVETEASSNRLSPSAPAFNSQENSQSQSVKPWISVAKGSEGTFDSSTTVTSMPAMQPHETLEPIRVPNAIDELEVTLEMEAQSSGETVNERFKDAGKEHEQALQRIVESTDTENDERAHTDRRYQYIVQPGDSIESVARVLLQDPMLAALLFNLNRRYILPEEQYGIHPLMVGVIIQLPTPSTVSH